MKNPLLASIALTCATVSSVLAEENRKAEPLRHPPSEAALAQLMATRSNPLAEHKLTTAVDRKSIEKKARSTELGGLIQRSTILAYGGFWTLVPKGAVLHVPPLFQSRLSPVPDGRLLPWSDFYHRNRGWIFTQPVGMANARGEESLSHEVIENHNKLGRLVVAVLQNCPISVKAPLPSTAGDGTSLLTSPQQ